MVLLYHRVETDWAILIETSQKSEEDPLTEYLELVALENQARVPMQAPSGWCSWYHYYQNVSAMDVGRNLQAATENHERWPLDLIQIDDGYETLVGEWDRFNSRFPDGVTDLATQIKAAGLMPGIWLAPFIFQPGAETVQKHPEWMIGDRNGRLRFAGFNWNNRTVALDLTHPGAQEWVRQTIQRAVIEWGFPYLKLDFLYAGGLSGRRHDPTRTNAQALYTGLKIIREEAGEDTFLLGCGCPVGAGVGIFDAMRISADTAPAWGNHYFGMAIPFLAEPNAPSAKNALHNVLTRANMHQKWWWNDPDCLLLRPESQLTLPEIQTVASVIALTGGMLLVSDDLQALPAERQDLLSQMLPPIQPCGVVLDWLTETEPAVVLWRNKSEFDPYALVALINWDDKPRRLTFDPKKFGRVGAQWLSSFWDGRLILLEEEQEATFDYVPAHGTVLLAIRNFGGQLVQYLGGNLHISQGLEVENLSFGAHRFELNLNLPRHWHGEIKLWVKNQPDSLNLVGGTLENWNWRDGILIASLVGKGKGQLVGVW
jgi:alpha-galactosidase